MENYELELEIFNKLINRTNNLLPSYFYDEYDNIMNELKQYKYEVKGNIKIRKTNPTHKKLYKLQDEVLKYAELNNNAETQH